MAGSSSGTGPPPTGSSRSSSGGPRAPSVHVTAATEPYGRRRDDRVERALDVPLLRTGSPYAVAPGRLTTRTGTPFQVFTPFRSAWLEHGWAAPAGLPSAGAVGDRAFRRAS